MSNGTDNFPKMPPYERRPAAAPSAPEQTAHETIVREGDTLVCTACGTSAVQPKQEGLTEAHTDAEWLAGLRQELMLSNVFAYWTLTRDQVLALLASQPAAPALPDEWEGPWSLQIDSYMTDKEGVHAHVIAGKIKLEYTDGGDRWNLELPVPTARSKKAAPIAVQDDAVRDAARYQWLRNSVFWLSTAEIYDIHGTYLIPELLDSAIDDAMQSAKPSAAPVEAANK